MLKTALTHYIVETVLDNLFRDPYAVKIPNSRWYLLKGESDEHLNYAILLSTNNLIITSIAVPHGDSIVQTSGVTISNNDYGNFRINSLHRPFKESGWVDIAMNDWEILEQNAKADMGICSSVEDYNAYISDVELEIERIVDYINLNGLV